MLNSSGKPHVTALAANPPEGEAPSDILGINSSTLSSSTVRTSFERVWSLVKPSKEEFVSTTSGYVDQLYRLAYSRVLNRQDAEDIVQETYLKAYRSYETASSDFGVKNWMTRILINTVHDHFRKSARTVPIADGHEIVDETAANSTISPEEQLCLQEIDPKLLGALKLIPDTYLVPLLLREIHDASYDEIANVLDVPKGTVMSRLSRGRALLRKGFFAGADGHQSIEDNGNPKNGSRGSFDEMH